MKAVKYIRHFFFIGLLLAGCLEPYKAPDVKENLNALVVDGFIDFTSASATVRLSRSVSLSNPSAANPEKKASVTIEEAGSSLVITLPETTDGLYTKTGLSLSTSKKYRLHVKTSAITAALSRNYYSEFIDLRQPPAIDSVYWRPIPEKEGVQIYVASHDPAKTTRYYQWTFVETYQHDAYYDSPFVMMGGRPVRRTPGTEIHRCWSTENSTKINVATTENLSDDMVRYPLTFIPKDSPKFSSLHGYYSILVEQMALDEQGFKFWQQLQKTTENIGGLFDPQPYQVTGNVHGTGNAATDIVLGYFGGGAVSTMRIFIDPMDVPDYAKGNVFPVVCELFNLEGPGSPPLNLLPDGTPLVLEAPATTSPGACIDCRVAGGTTTKPNFWP